MPRIKIDPSGTNNFASRLDSNISQLNSIASQINSAVSHLNWSVKSKSNINLSMQNALNKSNSLSSELRSLYLYVMNATNSLIEADNSGARGINKKFGKYTKNIIGINQKSYKNSKAGKKPKIKNPGDYYFEDEDGSGVNRVYYLSTDAGAGHCATMLEKSDGSAIYYSYAASPNAIFQIPVVGGVIGAVAQTFGVPGTLNRRDLSPEEVADFKKDGKLPDGVPNQNYTSYISVPVSEQQGKDMFSKGQELFNKERTEYSLTGNNCNQNAQKILSAANLDFTLSSPPKVQIGLLDTGKVLGAVVGIAQLADGSLGTNDSFTDKGGVLPIDASQAGARHWGQLDGYESGKFGTKS